MVRVARVVGWLLDFGRAMINKLGRFVLRGALLLTLFVGMLATLGIVFSVPAFAAVTWSTPYDGTQYPSPQAACDRMQSQYPGITAVYNNDTSYKCMQGTSFVYWSFRTGSCVAPETFDTVSGTCKPPANAVCQAGRVREVLLSAGTRTASGGSTDMTWPTNVEGCETSMMELVGCSSSVTSPAVGDTIKCRWRFILTGNALGPPTAGKQPTTDDTPKQLPSVPPFNPAQGQGCPAGTVNMGTDSAGQSICGGSGSTPSPKVDPATTVKPTATTSNADGSTTKVDVTERMNSDGSKTTTTKTTVIQADGTQSVSTGVTTGSTPAGLTGKPDPTKDEQEKDLCKLHPELNVCRNSTVSGSCGNIVCNGDAIQCAILRQQSKEYCENTTDNAASLLGKSIASGSDPMQGQISAAVTGTSVDLSSQSLDQGGFVSGAACLANRTITLVGKPITVSFTSVCNHILPLRAAIISCALIVAYLLVSKSVLQG